MSAVAELCWKRFDDLDNHELYAILRLRNAVFVVEQNCPYDDPDGLDQVALHLLARLPDVAGLAACLRVFPPGADGTPARIGRVATAREVRGRGLGRLIMQEALGEIGRRFGPCAVEISAQVASEPFYARLGFCRSSGDYDEDGIAHCAMRIEPGRRTG